MKKILPFFILLLLSFPIHAQTVESLVKSAIDKQNSGDNEGAVTDCNKALAIEPGNPVAVNVRGLSKFNLGLYNQAIDDFTKTTTTYPTNAIAYNYLGQSRYNLGQYKEALKLFTQAIKLDPKYASAYNDRGNNRVKLNMYLEAIADFNASIAINPDNAAAYNNRAFAKTKLGKYKEAIPDCDKAIALDNKTALAGAYRNRGNAKIGMGMYEDGVADCNKAITLDLQNPKAYNYRGYAYYKLGKYELAIKDDESSTDFAGDDETPQFWNYRDDAVDKLKKLGGSSLFSPAALAAAGDAATNGAKTTGTTVQTGPAVAIAVATKPADAPAAVPAATTALTKPTDAPVATPTMAEVTKAAGPLPQAPASAPAIVPATVDAQKTTTATVAAATTIAPPESNAANSFVNLQWLKPVDDISSLPDGIDRLVDNNEVTIKIKAVSNTALDKTKFRLFVNNQDYNDGNKMTVADIQELKNKATTFQYTYFTTLKVPIGKSVIKLTYGNTASDELIVDYTPTDINLHVLAIGIHGLNLKFPETDAKDFAGIFAAQKGEKRLFHDVSTELLLGDTATARNMADKIKEWGNKQYNERDVLMLFISSHGFAEDGKLLITGSDFKAASKRYTTIDFKEDVLDPLENVNCKKFIFIDACKSGAGITGSKSTELDVANEINKMAKSGNGTTIISSSSSSELSWEDDSWGNGAFTKAIKEGLVEMKADKDENGLVSMNELYDYVKTRVADLVAQAGKKDLSGNPVTQTPKMFNPRGNVSIYQKL